MNCKNFLALDNQEQAQYMAELIHACQSSDILFEAGKVIIEHGKEFGLFDKVTIGIPPVPSMEETTT